MERRNWNNDTEWRATLNQEERKKLAEMLRNLKPGESLAIVLENKEQAAEIGKEASKQTNQ